MKRTRENSPAVYVGTYKKYNNGSIKGAWLYLVDYASYKDFLNACAELHKDERDPEFMIQDAQNFPDGLSCMEWMSEEEFNDVKLAMKEEEQEAEGKPSINIIDYSARAFAVVGDTKAVKDELKRMGGSFNSKLSCGAGWIFSNKKRAEVEKFIASGEVADAVRNDRKEQTKGSDKFVHWHKEFAAQCGDEYRVSHSVGAIKLRDKYYLIDKPSIETRFCFHDEGPQYELYKDLTSDEECMSRYFKDENLSDFDSKIKRIEKGEEWSEDKRVWCKADEREQRMLLRFYGTDFSNDDWELCTDEEKGLILQGLKFGRQCFEKRLDAYLKRYGTKKLHTWTYWADA